MASALIVSVIAMTPVHGQEVELSPEAAVAHFLERQATASWQPFELFDDCAVQGAWENRAFELLASAQLSFDELSALAIAWQGVLTACGEPRLESWYFDQIEAGIAAGVPAGNFSTLWRALEGADSPRVRSFLLEITTDESIPPEYRDAAGSRYFVRLDDEELRREYLRLFAARQLPLQVSWFFTDRLIREDAGRTLQEIATLVRQDPHLAHQVAFSQAVASARQHASEADRRDFAEVLEDVSTRPGLLDRQVDRLSGAVRALRSER